MNHANHCAAYANYQPPYYDCTCGADDHDKRVGSHEPMPVKNDRPSIQDLVIRDIETRKAVGLERYGTLLQAHNGRDALMDAYQEALDLCQYLRQAIEERDDTVRRSGVCLVCKAANGKPCLAVPHP